MYTYFVIPGFADSVKLSITCFVIINFLAFHWLVR